MLTKSEKYKKYIVNENRNTPLFVVDQSTYRFENGFGASVIYGLRTYGLEVAVLKFDDVGNYKITDDVNGDVDDLDDILSQIKEL